MLTNNIIQPPILDEPSMKPFKVVTDPAAMELLGDETRRRIIYLLRARESTISQVADELKLTPQAIYHHVKKLVKAGLIEVEREERVENFIEKYYRASAEVFELSWGAQGKTQTVAAEHRLRDALRSLPKVGINVQVEDTTVSKISKIQNRLGVLGERKDLEEKIANLADVDFVGKQELASVARMISMSDRQFQEWMRLQRSLRTELKRLLSAKSKR